MKVNIKATILFLSYGDEVSAYYQGKKDAVGRGNELSLTGVLMKKIRDIAYVLVFALSVGIFSVYRKASTTVSMCDRLIMILNGIGCIWLVKSELFLYWISSISITDITFYLN